METKKNKVVSIVLDVDLLARLDSLAKKARRKRSSMVRVLIQDAVKKFAQN